MLDIAAPSAEKKGKKAPARSAAAVDNSTTPITLLVPRTPNNTFIQPIKKL